MSEANGTGPVIAIPSDFVTVQLEGAEFRLPLCETVRKFDALRKEVVQRQGTFDDYHAAVAQALAEAGAPQLTLEQAETVAHHLEVAALEKKQRRASAFAAKRQSLGTTG